MKKIKETERFICDECSKTVEIVRGSGFPYEKGWAYLYCLGFKFRNNDRKKSRDKHFCSKMCLIKFVLHMLFK